MLVGAGVSAVSAGPRATADDVEWTRALCRAGGQAVVVEEGLMDAVTGVSGSGPAYVLYFIEALTEAGIEQGLDPEVAAVLAAHTGLGAAKLLVETGETPQALRAKVTTPGGTTEAAIRHMEESKLRGIIRGAVAAATQRGKELGGE
jgi:pyrroline-5-carboxylate reductase